MARSFAIISSSGGIAAGSPFIVRSVLAVEQASPPVAFTQRMAFVGDPEESIIAPGVLAGAGSFIMGRGVIDDTSGANSVLVGDGISQSGAGGPTSNTGQVVFGRGLVIPAGVGSNNENLVALVSGATLNVAAGHNSFGGSVLIGTSLILSCALSDGINSVLIGSGVHVTGSDAVAIGTSAVVSDDQGVAIGRQASAGSQSTVVGSVSSAPANSVAVGTHVRAGTNGVAIGSGADNPGGDSCVLIGRDTNAFASTATILIGRESGVNGNNLVNIGSRNYPVFEFHWGAGFNTDAPGQSFVFNTTELYSGSGNNLAGMSHVIRAGCGTGNWANTQNLGLDFQVGIAGGSGSAQQAYTSALAIRHSDLNIALWGGLATDFKAGRLLLFFKDAAAVPTGAPVGGAFLYSVAGVLTGMGASGVATPLAA